jgi:RNase adapter protein RapZ
VRLVIVTGLSGAGKSTALRALEDLDYFCVDNLPLPLLEGFVELLAPNPETQKAALVIDAREGEFLRGYREAVRSLRTRGHPVEVLFLDASDDMLLRRFSETRRRHPVAGDDLRAGIEHERALLQPLREDAEAVVDTGNLNVHQLKGIIQERYGKATGALSVTLLSFGYKHGYPAEADVVFDVRFLPNPYFVQGLSPSTGLDAEVARFVLENDDAREFLRRTEDFLVFSLPRFEREGKAYLTVAVGCTGGRHRSVAVVQELGRRLGGKWSLTVRHRDLEHSPPATQGAQGAQR